MQLMAFTCFSESSFQSISLHIVVDFPLFRGRCQLFVVFLPNMKHRILFICLGNICRSPAAEGIMRHLVEQAGLAEDFFVDSAGIGNWHVGELPDRRMRRRGALRGYDFNSRARQFTPSDFDRFDLICVMDRNNLHDVLRQQRRREDASKVGMLTDYLNVYKGTTEIPDPYYGDDADFDWALDLIEDACAQLLQRLTSFAP